VHKNIVEGEQMTGLIEKILPDEPNCIRLFFFRRFF